MQKEPTAQIAHLVFRQPHKTNAKKPKELFFSQRRTELKMEKLTLKTGKKN